MKLWIDDVRPAPEGYVWCKSVNGAKWYITTYEARAKEACEREPELSKYFTAIELVDIDHDAGDYAVKGGDYINLLNWFEETGRDYPIRIHSMNPVGVQNMRAIIKRNGWKEVIT